MSLGAHGWGHWAMNPTKVVEQFLRGERSVEEGERWFLRKNGTNPAENDTDVTMGIKANPVFPVEEHEAVGEVDARADDEVNVNPGPRKISLSSSSDAYQDFYEIRSRCLAECRLFEDSKFPPVDSSMFKEKMEKDVVWLRPGEICKDPQLFVEGQSRFDVHQGDLGNCWLLVAVTSLTLNKKQFFKVVPDDQSFDEGEYAGVFHFRFWQYGRWVDVVIDDRLPTSCGKLIFLHSPQENEFWCALLEKAYAKLHGSYEALKGGNPGDAMEDFTGGVAEAYDISELPSNFFTILLKAYERNSLIGCNIEHDPNNMESQTSTGLIRSHSYSVTHVRYVEIETFNKKGKLPFLRLRNPWGSDEWKGPWSDNSLEWHLVPKAEQKRLELKFQEDGEFWISYCDFIEHFSGIQICNLDPDSLDTEDYSDGSTKAWEMSIYEGQWISGVTAGGCPIFHESFWRNPQYIVTLRDRDEEDDDNQCTIIIALMQKNRPFLDDVGPDYLYIGFTVYHLPDCGQVPTPLDRDFFENNHPVERSNIINLRAVNSRFKLDPGTYVIVPATYDPDMEGEFILRVFTEKPTDDDV